MSERGEIVAWQCQWGGSCPDYHDEFDPIPKEWDGPPDVITPLVRQSDYLAMREELVELRQAVWEARAILGFDNDGDGTPAALVYPTLAELVVRDAKESRKDYDDAANELAALKARIAESAVAYWHKGRVKSSPLSIGMNGKAEVGQRVRLLLEEP